VSDVGEETMQGFEANVNSARQEARRDTGGTNVDTVDTDRSLANHHDDQRVRPRRSAIVADEE
jgi:hypothetical protein